MFNDYSFDEYIATLEVAVFKSQTESAGAIFLLENGRLMPHKTDPDSTHTRTTIPTVNYVCQVDEWLFKEEDVQ